MHTQQKPYSVEYKSLYKCGKLESENETFLYISWLKKHTFCHYITTDVVHPTMLIPKIIFVHIRISCKS